MPSRRQLIAAALLVAGLARARAQSLGAPETSLVAPDSAVGLRVDETAREVRIELDADVLFDFDRAVLTPKARAALTQAGERIRNQARGRIAIDGHTDAKGDDAYNLRLSQQRAEAVKRWLAEQAGVPASRMRAVGYGRQRPVAPNTRPDGADDPEGRRPNRRVEIRFDK